MGRLVCILSHRAGAGKTTTAISLATALAISGRSTLLVDFDPLCAATRWRGQTPVAEHPALLSGNVATSIQRDTRERPQLLPGCAEVAVIERLLTAPRESLDCGRSALRSVAAGYDWTFLDCPSSLGRMTEIALSIADEIMIPIRCDYFALEGVAQFIQLVKKAIDCAVGELHFAGILLTLYEDSLETARSVDNEVRDFFGDITFETVIPRDASVPAAHDGKQSVIEHAPRSCSARAYIELCMEVLDRD